MKTCFFIGHRDAPDSVLPALKRLIPLYIAYFGVDEFLVGSYGSFDRMATLALLCAKAKYPHIRLLRLLPYHPAERAAWF